MDNKRREVWIAAESGDLCIGGLVNGNYIASGYCIISYGINMMSGKYGFRLQS